ncbi:MAG: hypothetical protein O2854_08455 [Chloroflexi bacterium]|nr:hypothetical protein [Chloroflexota bacterium]
MAFRLCRSAGKSVSMESTPIRTSDVAVFVSLTVHASTEMRASCA